MAASVGAHLVLALLRERDAPLVDRRRGKGQQCGEEGGHTASFTLTALSAVNMNLGELQRREIDVRRLYATQSRSRADSSAARSSGTVRPSSSASKRSAARRPPTSRRPRSPYSAANAAKAASRRIRARATSMSSEERCASSALTSSSTPFGGGRDDTATTGVSRDPTVRKAAARSRRARI